MILNVFVCRFGIFGFNGDFDQRKLSSRYQVPTGYLYLTIEWLNEFTMNSVKDGKWMGKVKWYIFVFELKLWSIDCGKFSIRIVS